MQATDKMVLGMNVKMVNCEQIKHIQVISQNLTAHIFITDCCIMSAIQKLAFAISYFP